MNDALLAAQLALAVWTLLLITAAAVEDPATIHAALDRGGRALRGLIERLMPVVHARARRRFATRSPAEREDAVQEVFVRLLADDGRLLRAYDPARGVSLEGYVGLLAERHLISDLRRQTAEKRGGRAQAVDDSALQGVPGAGDDPEQAAVAGDLARALGEHLRTQLPELGRLVFRLLYTDDCSADEAARRLNVNRQVIYNWQHRIRTEVRAFLATAEPA